jgi:hypothetical protein
MLLINFSPKKSLVVATVTTYYRTNKGSILGRCKKFSSAGKHPDVFWASTSFPFNGLATARV